MPHSPPGRWLCGTLAPGWFNGDQPSHEGDTVDASVCFQFENDMHSKSECKWEIDASVTNCGDFNVYYLPDTPEPPLKLRYCGNGA